MLMTKLKLYTTVAAIEAACVAFGKRATTLQDEAHKIACSVLAHVGEHSDVRVVTKFLESMPGSYRTNAVRSWFETFGPITFNEGKAVFCKNRKTRLGEAMEKPFWKFKPEEAYVPIDAAKALESLIKKLQKDQKETGTDHLATINALRVVPVTRPVNVTVQ
jgi:hypothetical protein